LRALAGLLACLALTALPGTAGARTLTATDHLAGMRFVLSGRTLTLRIVSQPKGPPAAARKKLVGHRVRADCAPAARNGRADPAKAVHTIFRWPRTARSRRVRFPRDVSARARFCFVETPSGADIALVDFRLGHNPFE
jgi:hypothetical protein